MVFAGWEILASTANGTTIVPKTLAALCAESDMVFLGRVAAVESRWADPQQRSIETVVTFSDIEPIFGLRDSTPVRLRFAGGQVGTVREVVAGIPEFSIGERVLVFAHRRPGASPIVGFHQGYLRVRRTHIGEAVFSATGRPVTTADPDTVLMGTEGAGEEDATALSAFLAVVRNLLAARTPHPTP